MDSISRWLKDMIDKGLASTTSSWIERAVEQRNERLTISVASSVLYSYSELDKLILQTQKLN
jgi:hypothetical protein